MASLRLASYNVHMWRGLDRRRDPHRTLRVLEELDADVVVLQEAVVPFGHQRPGKALARATDMEALPGVTMFRKDAHYGNMLLSRLPVLSVRRLDLSWRRREPRGAIDAVLDLQGTPVRVVATHLGLSGRERLFQVGRILDALDRHPEHGAAVTVLAGDCNEWLPWARTLRALRNWFGDAPAPKTFPVRHPVLPLDRVWARPAHCLRAVEAHRSELARVASDHLPLLARLQW